MTRRDCALITGASAGIGKAFATEFARNDFDLVLVARRAERLEAVAGALSEQFGIEAHTLAADLARPEAAGEIAAELAARGLEIDALVNNAGFGVPGLLTEVDWPRHRACLEVMTAAPVYLAWLLAPKMAARGRGWIVNISSLAAYLPPHAGGTLYYPVKSFMLQFSLALRAELAPDGIGVTAVCPGFTRTEFQDAAGGSVESVTPKEFMWMEADAVARAGFAAAMRGDAVCIPGLVNKALAAAFKLMPGAIGRWLVGGKA